MPGVLEAYYFPRIFPLLTSSRRYLVRKVHPMYFLLLSAVLFASSASVAQTYQNLVPPAGIATSAGEPSIGVNWNTGKILFQAGLETDRVTINGTSATWEDVSSPETSALSLGPNSLY